jgi:hypothetical protein
MASRPLPAVQKISAVTSQLDINALASNPNLALLNIKTGAGGATQITAETGALGGGGTTSFDGGGVNVFTTPSSASAGGTVSFAGGGNKFFDTSATTDTTTGVTLGAGGNATLTQQSSGTSSTASISDIVSSLTGTDWLIIGGLAVAAVLAYTLIR